MVSRFMEKLKVMTDENEKHQQLIALNLALQALEGKQVGLYEVKKN